jgi:hypothetical protein
VENKTSRCYGVPVRGAVTQQLYGGDSRLSRTFRQRDPESVFKKRLDKAPVTQKPPIHEDFLLFASDAGRNPPLKISFHSAECLAPWLEIRERWLLKTPGMRDRVKLPLFFDPGRLQNDLKSLQDSSWIDHFVKQNYTGRWSVIPLRGPAGAAHPVMMIYSNPSCTSFADTPFLALCPYFREVLSRIECELLAVRLMKLEVQSVIKEHRDHDLSLDQGTIRLHIPVITNPQVEFFLNGAQVEMREGECWYLRLSDPHRVANNGPIDRIHLVIDARVNPWLEKLLVEG